MAGMGGVPVRKPNNENMHNVSRLVKRDRKYKHKAPKRWQVQNTIVKYNTIVTLNRKGFNLLGVDMTEYVKGVLNIPMLYRSIRLRFLYLNGLPF